jgi:FtsH-binding integral membrane protein
MDKTQTKPSWGNVALGAFSTPEQAAFVYRVYGWMAGGLVISALMALFVAMTPAVAEVILGNRIVFYGLIIAEFAAVIFLSLRLERMSSNAAAALFLIYSALNGLTLSVVFFMFTLGSVSGIFLVTAGMFAGIATYGYLTKRDLTTIGSFASMALFGLVLAMLVNLFFKNAQINMMLAGLGVFIFTILTAYDTQKLKWLYQYGAQSGTEGESRMAIQGALALYLDFVNLFLELLQLFGRRR